nr:C10 family peptidase [uncultured Porphyromonas sp.]
MNRIYYLATLALLALASCTNLDDDFRPSNPKKQPSQRSEVQRYQVSLRSATYFAQKLQLEDGVSRQIKSIEPVASGQDTLLYFVNYAKDQGWVVLSGDKRTEAILASSTVGSIEKDALGGSAVWFDDLAGKIYGIKHSNSKASQSGDYAMWCKIDTLTLGLRPERKEARALPPKEPGEYDYEDVLVDSKVEVVVDKSVGPLIKTKWGQSEPWNSCTPYWQDTKKRCPTGCVAVAGAQMLYYFHSLKNKPRVFFSQGSCRGWIGGRHSASYSFSFSNPQEDVWDQMALYKREPQKSAYPVALLMGFVGSRIDMKYSDKASGADDEKLVRLYRDFFGIRSEYADYKEELVRASLDNNLPVNVSAYAERRRPIEFIGIGWIYDRGHAWIIDGYKDKRICYTYTYERRPWRNTGDESYSSVQSDQQSTARTPRVEPSFKLERPKYEIIETSTVSISYFWKMNLGWNGQADDADYGTWEGEIWDAGGHRFEYKKKIIHNFSF